MSKREKQDNNLKEKDKEKYLSLFSLLIIMF